jgi:hypothetical protein
MDDEDNHDIVSQFLTWLGTALLVAVAVLLAIAILAAVLLWWK